MFGAAGAERGRDSEAVSSRSESAKSQLLRRQPEALVGSPVPAQEAAALGVGVVVDGTY